MSLNFSFLLSLDVTLRISSVSGRTGNYKPKVWALVDHDDQESENSIKLRTTKRTADVVKTLGNGAVIKATIKLETANEKREFGENGDTTEYYETVTQYTIVKVAEVVEKGTMPEKKADDTPERISA